MALISGIITHILYTVGKYFRNIFTFFLAIIVVFFVDLRLSTSFLFCIPQCGSGSRRLNECGSLITEVKSVEAKLFGRTGAVSAPASRLKSRYNCVWLFLLFSCSFYIIIYCCVTSSDITRTVLVLPVLFTQKEKNFKFKFQ